MSFIVHPSKWEAQHAAGIFQGQAYQATHDGQLPDTPMWRMLEFRHSLNPARFDYWHPNVGRMLEGREAPLEMVRFARDGRHSWVGRMRGPAESPQALAPGTFALPPSLPPQFIPDVSAWRAIEPAPPHLLSQPIPEPTAALQGLTALALTTAVLIKRLWPRRMIRPGV